MAENPMSQPVARTGHHFAQTTAYNSYVHQGDVYHVHRQENVHRGPDEVVQYGLCLNLAPLIDPSYFVGRAEEINAITEVLHPGQVSTVQRRLVLGGMGGVGKTQLALAYAQQYRTSYTSVFWLNAMSALTLKASFRSLAGRVLRRQDLEASNDEQTLAKALAWLANTHNTQWLLIFDNYDEPDQFNVDEYCPFAGHGSVLVTTRRPTLVKGPSVHVQPLTRLEDSLDVLQVRSGRENIKNGQPARASCNRGLYC